MASEELLRNIRVPPREAIAYLAGKTNVTSQHWTDVWREGHTRSFMVAGAATDALVADFRTEVARAIEQGTTLQDFRKQFDSIVGRHGWEHNGSPGWRSRIIYETNLSTAYAAGRYAQQTEPDTLAVYPYWQYVHSGAAHPRLQHQAWNGLTLLATDSWWRTHYPPNGWRCGCRVRVLSARGLARQGKSGPDQAPIIETRRWVNPRTSEVHYVPIGIDPGFDYNPGMAWRGEARFPDDTVTRVPPGNWPPPAPPIPAAAIAPPAAAILRPIAGIPKSSADDALGTAWIREPGSSLQPREFRDLAEADRVMTDLTRPWAEALSAEQRAAIDAYKGGMGRAINAVLRGEEALPALEGTIRDLRDALDLARLPETVRAYRGVGPTEAALLRTAGVDGTVVLRGVVSTALDIATANAYAAREGGPLVELLLPAQLRGAAYVHPFPGYRYRQYELLIAPGARYRVLRIEDNRIVLEVLHRG